MHRMSCSTKTFPTISQHPKSVFRLLWALPEDLPCPAIGNDMEPCHDADVPACPKTMPIWTGLVPASVGPAHVGGENHQEHRSRMCGRPYRLYRSRG